MRTAIGGERRMPNKPAVQRAALYTPAGLDPSHWHPKMFNAAAKAGLLVVTLTNDWTEVQRLIWCEQAIDVVVVGTRSHIPAPPLMVCDEHTIPPEPVPSQRRARRLTTPEHPPPRRA
jgi:hypothetical protein